MKKIVTECLKSHKFKYQIGDKYNKGYSLTGKNKNL